MTVTAPVQALELMREQSPKTVEPELPFSLSTLRAAIPPHCLVKDTYRSIGYMLRDFAFIGCMYALYPYINAYDGAFNPCGVLKFVWWNAVGFLFWCLFVVGHDCGHRTFSPSVLACDVFGHICHAPLLVPFHGWRVSHRKHHENHNHVEKDHSWRPVPRAEFIEFQSSTMSRVIRFTYVMLIAYPVYLVMDSPLTSGSHFNPYGRLFSAEERVGAWISAVSVVSWAAFLLYTVPLLTLLDAYLMPIVFFWVWLDLVTYLHHTDGGLSYYRDGAWSFLKGGLSTIDRSFGYVLEHLHHDIGTHMVHHLFFTRVPHYHLVEATEALKPVLGSHYKFDDTPAWKAYLRSKETCHWVADEGNVLQYKTEAQLGNGIKTL